MPTIQELTIAELVEEKGDNIIGSWINGNELTEEQIVILYLVKRLMKAESKLDELLPELS